MIDLMEKEKIRTYNVDVANVFGVTEAVMLNQIEYWIRKKNANKKEYKSSFQDGRCWVYNTYKGWGEQFPCYSEMTIRRALTNLVNRGVLIKGNYNKLRYDNTNWYTIDYECLENYLVEAEPPVQNEQTPVQNEQMEVFKENRPIPKTTTMISTKTSSQSHRAESCKNTLDCGEQKVDFNILNRQIRSVCIQMGMGYFADSIVALFKQYYKYYKDKMGHDHKYLKNENIMEAIEEFNSHYLPANVQGALIFYEPMMKEYFFGNNHFTGNGNGECDYSILHFLSTFDYREYNAEKAGFC